MLASELARQIRGRRRPKILANPPSIRPAPPTGVAPFPLESQPSRRLLGLDVLRGVAILLVVCGHLQFRMPANAVGFSFWTHVRQLALSGVDVFLVLSGFLIGGMLLTELNATGRVLLGRFFARRAWRLLPVYLLAILLGWRWYHWVR